MITVNKRILVTFAIIIGVIGLCVSLFIHLYHPLPEDYFLEGRLKVIDKPNFIIMYSHKNISVVDCSPTSDEYNLGHRLPGAIWSTVPSMFYTTTNRIVVYSDNDTRSHDFCLEILRHVKNNNVFIFKGGYSEWNTEQ